MTAATAFAMAVVVAMVMPATASAVMLQVGKFLFGSVAHLYDLSDEMEVFARKRMVEVNGHMSVGYFGYLGIDNLARTCGHRHNIAYKDTLGIELAVNLEHLTPQCD